MAYQNRTPSVKLKVSVENFNSLIEYIIKVENSEEPVIKDKATKLKEKLLRYSIPITTEENEELIEMRFFPNESGNMIDVLLYEIDDITPNENYYDILLGVRVKMKEQFNKNKE